MFSFLVDGKAKNAKSVFYAQGETEVVEDTVLVMVKVVDLLMVQLVQEITPVEVVEDMDQVPKTLDLELEMDLMAEVVYHQIPTLHLEAAAVVPVVLDLMVTKQMVVMD